MQIIGSILFAIVSLLGAAYGALKCFAPQTLANLLQRARPDASWSVITAGQRTQQSGNAQALRPSIASRLSGLFLMLVFLYMLLFAIGRLLS